MSRLPLIALVLLGGCATAENQAANADRRAKAEMEIAETLRGLSPGEPETCINQRRVQNIDTYEGTILYRVSSNLIYRNNVSTGCFGLPHDDIVVSRTPSTQLCRGEIIQTVDSGSRIPTGSCALGDFIPYRK